MELQSASKAFEEALVVVFAYGLWGVGACVPNKRMAIPNVVGGLDKVRDFLMAGEEFIPVSGQQGFDVVMSVNFVPQVDEALADFCDGLEVRLNLFWVRPMAAEEILVGQAIDLW